MESSLAPKQIQRFVETVTEEDLHAKRVLSVSHATIGVIHAASLGVYAIGRALAQARGLRPKHAIKQVDRLLSNSGVDPWTLFGAWVPFVVAERKEIVVALDWTDFDADDQATLALHLITRHGRATPLLWHTVRKSEMNGQRNGHEDRLLKRLREVLPAEVHATILADRGFGDHDLYALLQEFGFGYVIRFRGDIKVKNSATGERRAANEWVPSNGRALRLENAFVTADEARVPAVVCVKKKGMKDSWCLAVGSREMNAAEAVKLYSKRFTIEESFRDAKDIHFGMGLSSIHIQDPARRDRLLLISALATVLITLLGAAGEAIGLDRTLQANTSRKRQYSLFFQGSYYYGALPNMRPESFDPLIRKFGELLSEQRMFREIFGLI
jgi:hypothetical protein